MKNVVKDHRITLPVLLDKKEQVARTYGVRMIPTVFLINREGWVEGTVVGQRDWCAPEALSAVMSFYCDSDSKTIGLRY